MAEIIRMPRLSDTMEEGNIVSWLVKEGDKVSPGDVLAEVETDKATMELESFNEGVLLYIGVKEGPVPVDGIIAIIGAKGDDYKKLLAEAESATSAAAKEESAPAKTEAPAPAAPAPAAKATPAPAAVVETNHNTDRILASPLARSLATEKGYNLEQITGTGDGGRIIKRDVETFTPSAATAASSKQAPRALAPDIQYGDAPVSQMRKVIARRLSESKFGAPHFYLTVEIDMGNAMAARKQVNAQPDIKVSFNDIIMKACAVALRKHPAINSSWHGDKITYHEEINIGVAVAIPDGLMVPVVRDTDLKTLSQINAEVKDLAGKAKNKKLSTDEMTGNTFTISNLGNFGIEEFTAIINPPDACILAVGSIMQKPIVKDGAIVVGNMMKVTLSCDHRVVDGVTGANFLATLKGMLESPMMMLA